MDLAERHCVPCHGGTPVLHPDEQHRLLGKLEGWHIVNAHHLSKHFTFPDFRTALTFVDRIGAVAEQEGHHPELELAWGKVEIRLWTHASGGLTENDFILAAKVDALHPN
jgi:4a-hydroxytetrahydrobiopterin dehydratase